MKLSIFLRGFLMGCADIVPGVSGGTVALVTGIYERLIDSIRKVTQAFVLCLGGQFKKGFSYIDFSFLIPLICGVGLAIVLMAKLITQAMEDIPELTLALFFGLMMGSITIVGKMIHEKSFLRFTLLFVSAMFALILTSSTPLETEASPLYFFFSGMVAIVAMILPGVSGSFLLLIMGKYMQVMTAIKSMISLCKDAIQALLNKGPVLSEVWLQMQEVLLGTIVPFGLGCVLGLASFSWVLTYFLKHHKSLTLTVLLGLMLGSMHKLWPFRITDMYLHREGKADKVLSDTTIAPYLDEPMHLGALALIVAGFFFVLWIDKKAGVSKLES